MQWLLKINKDFEIDEERGEWHPHEDSDIQLLLFEL